MKKYILLVFILFSFSKVNSQVILCDSILVSGSQYQFTISINTSFTPVLVDYWVTTSNSGFVLAEDSISSSHVVFNNPATAFDTITTCLHYMNTVCCVIFIWDGSGWVSPTNSPTASWDCSPNSPLGCYDPGTGMGQYSSLAACQAVCGSPTPSWNCSSNGCYNPGTGMGQYSSLVACQAVCVSTASNACDSMTLVSTGGSLQTILVAEVPISFMDIHYWITTAPDGTVLGEDSMWNSHQIFNNMNNGQPYDTINICVTYIDNNAFNTCCVTWIWNPNLGIWYKVGSITSTNHFLLSKNKLVKIVDVFGRKVNHTINKTLFYIYEGGRVEKKFIYE